MATNINLNLDLDSLSDVDLTDQAVGFVLVYDGTNWVPTDTVFLDEANKRVGIGTASPTSKLTVSDDENQILIIDSNDAEDNVIFTYNLGVFSVKNADNGNNIFSVNDGAPNNSLRINVGAVIVNQNNQNFNFIVEGQTDSNLLFADASTDKFGIGTNTPSEKLEVNGKIKATDINFTGLPTSSVGLSSGDVWNDGGTLKIV